MGWGSQKIILFATAVAAAWSERRRRKKKQRRPVYRVAIRHDTTARSLRCCVCRTWCNSGRRSSSAELMRSRTGVATPCHYRWMLRLELRRRQKCELKQLNLRESLKKKKKDFAYGKMSEKWAIMMFECWKWKEHFIGIHRRADLELSGESGNPPPVTPCGRQRYDLIANERQRERSRRRRGGEKPQRAARLTEGWRQGDGAEPQLSAAGRPAKTNHVTSAVQPESRLADSLAEPPLGGGWNSSIWGSCGLAPGWPTPSTL